MPDAFSTVEAGLLARGFTADQAKGITAGIVAEGGLKADGTIINNPTSGAFGIGQWLNTRKQGVMALAISKGETSPSMGTQLDYLAMELRGQTTETGGNSVLTASGPSNIMQHYIIDFMRPASGAETTGDLNRGAAYLAANGVPVDGSSSIINEAINGVLNAINPLKPLGDAATAAAQKATGFHFPTWAEIQAWLQEKALGILLVMGGGAVIIFAAYQMLKFQGDTPTHG